MNVFVIGANGQIGKQLVERLKQDGKHEVTAMVRKQEQLDEFKANGYQAVLGDLEGDVETLKQAMSGMDAVVFAAGSGGSTGADKTLLIDLDGAAKSVEAAQANGNIKHFVMLSALKAEDRSAWPDSMKPYYVAKHHADRLLEQSGLDYTIVRPGALTDDAGTGKVNVDNVSTGEIPRADVAAFLAHVIGRQEAANKAIDLVKGDTAIEETI
ncbi:SDR family oxidoreductase [Exiguobacterium sp. SH3S2]|uniref:SDR family oxidoreductase n=1 Tax=Exiguobacterium TaxID=33986 RepID=UPI00087794FF|nr:MULTISPECIES: SDR family oxidoreductase [Exiguobacterium]TCI36524.1 SDR family oxidoreductase [Exiguobacterium sp. SH4S7]TCI43162.1 SDR family oxidoreductase [Exiguobacterium sp. SH3S3]TCI48576.1 SDR family oxidoreductase [Exiguobacterium sp. SH5S32]TCI55462.1 SDR family oxidoreductase [Exiguobacterium sp. SH1S4]TCI58933.1 SDR family oxidoreductase [Exiguobacterium sp. SH3S2]